MRNNSQRITIMVAGTGLFLFFAMTSTVKSHNSLNQVSTATTTVIPSLTPQTFGVTSTQPTDYVTHIELVDFLEKVTSQHLNTINISLGIVGIGLAFIGIFSLNIILRIQKVADESQDRIKKFEEKEKDWDLELQRVQTLTRLYVFVLELRDPNPDLRRRALHSLRATGDILAVSHVSYLLLSDPDSSIRAEAALSLNDLLPKGVEESTLLHAVGALTKGLGDKEKIVVLYSLKTLATLISRGESVPLFTLEKVREIANNKDRNLARVANDALTQSPPK